MLGNRISQYNAAAVPKVNQARSGFDRSHGLKDTHDVDYLYPIMVEEILPGDTVNIKLQDFSRLTASAQKVPLMDNLYRKTFFFFVPNRLLWENWERFQGAQDDPGDSTDFTIPTVPLTSAVATVDSLWNKMGINGDMLGATKSVNALFSRAYNLIYNQWFKSQDLQNSLVVDKDNGPDDPADYVLQKITKKHNYFTAGLPEPQKGDPVDLPLGVSAPVIGNGGAITFWNVSNHAQTGSLTTNAGGLNAEFNGVVGPAGATVGLTNNPANSGLIADLSSATAATINSVREAWKIQEIFELDARGGTRYIEILQNRFGVISPDFRLQRSEYLGGSTTKLNSHIVPQTSPTSGSNAQGALAAFGTMSGETYINKSFVEHGVLLGLSVVTGEISYQQGLHKKFTRQTRFDFFEPKLQELGEQAVLKQEIYCDGSATDDDVFAYMPRYDEYRFAPSRIQGQFNSAYSAPLDSWHLAEEFSNVPSLNAAFIVANTPIARNLAITTGPDLLTDMWFQFTHIRPMVTYSTPLSIGRF